MTIKNFEELEAWQETRKLNKIVYNMVNQPRVSHRLKEQIAAAALSIMTNIAEGFESQSNLEFIRFLFYARRSVAEVQSALYVVLDQEFITQDRRNSRKYTIRLNQL
jgi:four helix bundle protein